MVRITALVLAHLAAAHWTATWYDSHKRYLDKVKGNGPRGDGEFDEDPPDDVPPGAKYLEFWSTNEVFYMNDANGEVAALFRSGPTKNRVTPVHKTWSIQGEKEAVR